jgi:hypothetical protein
MYKYALGTIVGTALVGLVKSKGSASKMRASKTRLKKGYSYNWYFFIQNPTDNLNEAKENLKKAEKIINCWIDDYNTPNKKSCIPDSFLVWLDFFKPEMPINFVFDYDLGNNVINVSIRNIVTQKNIGLEENLTISDEGDREIMQSDLTENQPMYDMYLVKEDGFLGSRFDNLIPNILNIDSEGGSWVFREDFFSGLIEDRIVFHKSIDTGGKWVPYSSHLTKSKLRKR